MEYNEFVCAVEKEMNQKLKGGVKAEIYTSVKNNGRERKGIMIKSSQTNVSPTIYLEELYARFQRYGSLDDVVCQLLDLYDAIKLHENWNFCCIEHFEEIRDNIVFKLIHTERNTQLLEKVPHREFLDLSLVYYVLLKAEDEENGLAMMLIHNEHLQYWAVQEQALYAAACENVKRLLPARLVTMRQALGDILSQMPDKKEDLPETDAACEEDFLYVLSNPSGHFGAACMAYPGVLEEAGRALGGDYYILPSSVHEVVLVPKDKSMEQYVMNQMVQEINDTQVAEEEILSDHAYYYETGEGRLVSHQYIGQYKM